MPDEEKKEDKKKRKKSIMLELDNDDPAVCILSLEAYQQIVLHATRFANTKVPMDAWKEVMGFLVGTINERENQVRVKKAIPMAHGSSVEVEFGEEQYVWTAQINEWAAERDMFIVGWYHSHPGLGLFLSGIDVKNHLGYQGPNPQAIALVFDHTKIEEPGHPGFAIFKLDNPDLGTMSNFHAVRFKIEEIDMEKYLNSLYELSERAMLKQPLSPEYGEDISALGSSEDAGGVEISTTPIGNIEITLPSLNVDLVMEGMLAGFRRLTEEVMPPMLLASNEQNKATVNAFQHLANRQVKTLNELQELLSIGIGKLRKQVMAKIDESHEGLANIMSTNFSNQNEVLTKATDDISDMEDRVINDIVKTREEVLNQLGVKISELTNMLADDIKSVNDSLSDVQKELADQFKGAIEATHDELSNAVDLMKTQVFERLSGIEDLLKPKEEIKETPSITDQIKPLITEELEKVNKKIEGVKKTHEQILEKILLKIKGIEDKLAKSE
ncbi:MAG: Mov34/MPN/PAD-1 family protein [Promethearchaeota archaeon]